MPMAGAGGDLTTTVATAPTGTILVTAIGVIIITTTATTTINDDNGSGAGAYVLRSLLADHTQSLRASAGCPLYQQKRTCAVQLGMATIIAAAPHVLVVHPSFPANSLKGFVAIVRANPGKYSYASAGTGQSSHLAGELFKLAAGLDLVHVPFNGASPAMMSAVGGHVPIAFISLPAAVTFIKEGKLRGLAITGNARSKLLPEVPTMAEAGFGNQESIFMQGVLFPAGTAEDIVDRWYREIVDIVALPEVRDRLTSLGLEPIVNTPASFSVQIKSEVARWSKVIRNARIRPFD